MAEGTVEEADVVTVGSDVVELVNGDDRVEIDLVNGGRIAQISVGEQELLWPGRALGPIGWGSFPMAPWVGRIRAGRFRFDGVDHQLEPSHRDVDGTRHAIHGTVYTRRWTLDDVSTTGARLQCDLGSWPWPGIARQWIELGDAGVRCVLRVEATDGSFPGSIGWHPWFRKPDRLTFTPTKMYRRGDIGLPTAELVAPAAGPWDDTFLNGDPVTLHYDAPARRDARSVVVTSDCDHWVVYDEPNYATCVEPQSGPPDSPTMHPHLVTADHPLERWMTITWN
jgi:aldose 1-epimerase